jgi:hypothetical protein
MGNVLYLRSSWDDDESDDESTDNLKESTYDNPICCNSNKCECPVCMENTQLKKLLPCKHHACENCIHELLRNDGKCPYCRTHFTAYGCNGEYVPVEQKHVITEDNIIDMIDQKINSADEIFSNELEEHDTPFVLTNSDDLMNETKMYFERNLDRSDPNATSFEELFDASELSQQLYNDVYIVLLNGDNQIATTNYERIMKYFLMKQYTHIREIFDEYDSDKALSFVAFRYNDMLRWMEGITDANITGGKKYKQNKKSRKYNKLGRQHKKSRKSRKSRKRKYQKLC